MKVERLEASDEDILSMENIPNDSRPDDRAYSISDLAREYGLTLRALRFYESRGLINPMRAGSARLYGEQDRRKLGLIIKGKQLGFTLREISALISAEAGGREAPALKLTRQQCIEQIKLLERQKRDLEEAIGELRRTYSALYEQGLGDRLSRVG
jgi:DNA-binding transcriptional MerR regulator